MANTIVRVESTNEAATVDMAGLPTMATITVTGKVKVPKFSPISDGPLLIAKKPRAYLSGSIALHVPPVVLYDISGNPVLTKHIGGDFWWCEAKMGRPDGNSCAGNGFWDYNGGGDGVVNAVPPEYTGTPFRFTRIDPDNSNVAWDHIHLFYTEAFVKYQPQTPPFGTSADWPEKYSGQEADWKMGINVGGYSWNEYDFQTTGSLTPQDLHITWEFELGEGAPVGPDIDGPMYADEYQDVAVCAWRGKVNPNGKRFAYCAFNRGLWGAGKWETAKVAEIEGEAEIGMVFLPNGALVLTSVVDGGASVYYENQMLGDTKGWSGPYPVVSGEARFTAAHRTDGGWVWKLRAP